MAKIVIIGSGGWGIGIGVMLSRYHEITIWSAFDDEVEMLSREREYKTKLPGIKIPEKIIITGDKNCVKNCDIVMIATPSKFVRSVAKQFSEYIENRQLVLNISKGLDEDTLDRLSVVLKEEIPQADIAVLSGPAHAEEVARDVPTLVTVSAYDKKNAQFIQNTLMNDHFRIYTSPDIVGVELGGAFKNVIALAAGMCDGMKFGDNTKAALMTRGITEIANLGMAFGAKQETFAGLSGIGDLIVTCTSNNSRNYRCGLYIGQGMSVDKALEKVNMTVEGYLTAKSAYKLSKKINVEMPIIHEIYNVLYKNASPAEALNALMRRSKKEEGRENIWVK